MQLQYVRASACGKLVITNPLAVCNTLETCKTRLQLHTTVLEVLGSWLVPLNT